MSRKYQKWYNESLYRGSREMKTEELIELALEVGFDHAGELNMGGAGLPAGGAGYVFKRTLPGLRHPVELPAGGGGSGTQPSAHGEVSSGDPGTDHGADGPRLDSEGILQAEKRHKERFATLVRQIRYGYPDCLPWERGPVPVSKVHLSGPALPPSGGNVHFHGGLRLAGK